MDQTEKACQSTHIRYAGQWPFQAYFYSYSASERSFHAARSGPQCKKINKIFLPFTFIIKFMLQNFGISEKGLYKLTFIHI